MAGVDLDTSMLDPVIGVKKPPGKKTTSFKFRLSPRHGLEKQRKSEDCSTRRKKDNQLKHKDNWLLNVIEQTLESQKIPALNEELCLPWVPIDLKKRKKALVDGEDNEKAPSKKKSKSNSKNKQHKKSLKITLKTTRDPSISTSVEPSQIASEPIKCLEATPTRLLTASTLLSKSQPAQEIHSPASNARMASHNPQVKLDPDSCAYNESGVQSEGGRASHAAASNSRSLAGPESSLESSLVHAHRCLQAVEYGQRKTSQQLFQEGSALKDEADRKFGENNSFTIEIMLMKLRASVKYLEASINTGRRSRLHLLDQTGKRLFTIAKSTDKMASSDFVKACICTLAKRLGVCAHMQFAHGNKNDEQVPSVIRQAVDTAASTTKVLADLHRQANQRDPHIVSALVLTESILKNFGLGPLQEHLYIAGKAIEEFEKAKL